jgi:hypothetical protein
VGFYVSQDAWKCQEIKLTCGGGFLPLPEDENIMRRFPILPSGACLSQEEAIEA